MAKATKRRGGAFRAPVFAAKWITLHQKDGTPVRVQGSYEAAYAQYLIDHNIAFKAQPKPALIYTDRFGGKHSYTPDFWVDGVGLVEIKSKFTLARGRKKLDDVIASGHAITIYTEVEMAELGISVKRSGASGRTKAKSKDKGDDNDGINQSRRPRRKRKSKKAPAMDNPTG